MNLHPIYGASRSGSRPSRKAALAAGALFTYLAPRMATDAKLPSVIAIVEDVSDANFNAMVPQLARRVRRLTRGRLATDADIDDVEDLLEALADAGEEQESTPAFQEEGEDEDDDLLDEIKRLLRGKVDSQTMAQIDRMAGDRRRRRIGRDNPPPFSGRPNPGGSMEPIDEGWSSMAPIGKAWDRPARGSRPRRFGQDAAVSFEEMFPSAARLRVVG